MKIIGLLGGAGAGKSTAAEYLVKTHGARRYSFATPVKAIARYMFNFLDEQLYGTQVEKEAVDPRYGFSSRWAMEAIGMGVRQALGDDVFVNHLLKRLDTDSPSLVVIDDVRFINESEALKNLGGFVWRLEVPGVEQRKTVSESEWAKARCDRVIRPHLKDKELLAELIEEAYFNDIGYVE